MTKKERKNLGKAINKANDLIALVDAMENNVMDMTHYIDSKAIKANICDYSDYGFYTYASDIEQGYRYLSDAVHELRKTLDKAHQDDLNGLNEEGKGSQNGWGINYSV